MKYGSLHKRTPRPQKARLSKSDVAWIAGFLEGEGDFSYVPAHGKSHGGTQKVRATQVNREPLVRLAYLLGGAVKRGTF